GERRDVTPEARRVPPSQRADGRDCADPEPEMVPPVPVREIVMRAKVRSIRGRARATEVRRLVPAVADAGQAGDDLLEVVLHRVGLAREFIPEGMREARPRLGLQLVAREVVRLERERRVEVARQVGGALAGDSVDAVERDVGITGITQSVVGEEVVVWLRAAVATFAKARR